MAEPIIERISQNVLAALQGITVATGYGYDLEVLRPTRQVPKPKHLRAVLYQDDPERQDLTVNNKEEWIQPYFVNVYLMPGLDETRPIDQLGNWVWADLVKVLMADHTRGGLALDTWIRDPEHVTDNDEYDGFVFNFDVRYRTALGDAYTLAV